MSGKHAKARWRVTNFFSALARGLRTALTDFMSVDEPLDAPPPHPVFPVHWVTSHLGAGPAPHARAHLLALADQGIQCILNLCDELADLAHIEREAGFEVYHLPVIDEEAPELEALDKALDWLDEALFLGKRVYVHCRHGIGRTGTVINAYLLRKGLGHQLAYRTLRRFRSQPANYDQWRTVRRYAKRNSPLTLREPSLEFGKTVDLSPFIANFLALEEQVQGAITALPTTPQCGRDHSLCCRSPVSLSLIEALVLSSRLNTLVPSSERAKIIHRSVETSRKEREARKGLQGEYCLSAADALCPLSINATLCDGGEKPHVGAGTDGALPRAAHTPARAEADSGIGLGTPAPCLDRCLLFVYRPLKCRLFSLSEDQSASLWQNRLTGPLRELSAQVFLALSGSLPAEEDIRFPLPEVLSGRYVQTVFGLMLHTQETEYATKKHSETDAECATCRAPGDMAEESAADSETPQNADNSPGSDPS